MIGERLAEIRKDHGDKQPDLAMKLSVSVHTIGSWEQEKSAPDNRTLVEICKLYSVSADYLLGVTNAEQPDQSELSESECHEMYDFKRFLLWRREHRKKK